VSCQLCCSTIFRGGGSRHAFEPLQFPSKPLRPRRSPLEYHFIEYRAKSLVKTVAKIPAPFSYDDLRVRARRAKASGMRPVQSVNQAPGPPRARKPDDQKKGRPRAEKNVAGVR
jgi:hypothetical protein